MARRGKPFHNGRFNDFNRNPRRQCDFCPDAYFRGGEESHIRLHDYLMFRCSICRDQADDFTQGPLFVDVEEVLDHVRHNHNVYQEDPRNYIENPWDLRTAECRKCQLRLLARGAEGVASHLYTDHNNNVYSTDMVNHDVGEFMILGCRLCSFQAVTLMEWASHFSKDKEERHCCGNIGHSRKSPHRRSSHHRSRSRSRASRSRSRRRSEEGPDATEGSILHCRPCNTRMSSPNALHRHYAKSSHLDLLRDDGGDSTCAICQRSDFEDKRHFVEHLSTSETHGRRLRQLSSTLDDERRWSETRHGDSRPRPRNFKGHFRHFFCGLCRLPMRDALELHSHYEGQGHQDRLRNSRRPFTIRCAVCGETGTFDKHSFNEHLQSETHLRALDES